MSRIWVSNDGDTVRAEIELDDDGAASAACTAGDWCTDPDREYGLRDAIEDAGSHLDRDH